MLFAIMIAGASAASDDPLSPDFSARLRLPAVKAPAEMPKTQTASKQVQVQGVDAELSVGLAGSPSVFDDLSPQNGSQQKAQILLKRNLLDDVTISNTNNVGLADTTPTKNNGVTAQSAQNQSTTELKWNANDNLSLTGSNKMDQIFEFQRAEPSHISNGIETRYKLRPETSLGVGVNNENYYDGNAMTFQRQTATTQYQQKLGKLPLNWTASPSLVTERSLTDLTQDRAGKKLDQSLLWAINSDTSWNVGSGFADWSYDYDSHILRDRTLYSQWSRQLRPNVKLTLRTDLETTETLQDSATTREDKFKLSIGQQVTLADDLFAAFDLKQEYQRDINSTWVPADHAATISIQKKF